MRETQDLPPITFQIPETLDEITKVGPSSVGNSAVGAWLSCPRYSQLAAEGVEQKPSVYETDYGLSALAFGSLFHALRAVRFVHGLSAAEGVIVKLRAAASLNDADSTKVLLMLRLYDAEYPIAAEPFDILGVECEVLTNIKDWYGRPLFRSVRYDTVIRMKDESKAIFSLECKTMARSGATTLNAYTTQGYVHSAVWNANKALVEKYGVMQGTIWDCAVKTATPSVDRVGPRYFTGFQQQLALDYLRLPEAIQMPILPDGVYPKFLHTCYGRWSPCRYINGCHENAWGDYQKVDKQTGEATPYWPPSP